MKSDRKFMSIMFFIFGVGILAAECVNLYRGIPTGPAFIAGIIAIVYSFVRYFYLTKE